MLGVERALCLARRARLVLARLLADADKLGEALEPILSAKGGTMCICGLTRDGEATLSWDDSRSRADLRAPADFILTSVSRKTRKSLEAETSFATISAFSPTQALDSVEMFIEHLRGSDEAVLASLRRDYPHLHAFLERLAVLDSAEAIRMRPDHTVISLQTPLNRAAIKAHYPAIDRVHRWVKELRVEVTDDQERVLARIRFDGSRRLLHIDGFARGKQLLWSDGERPLRNGTGDVLPLAFALTESRSFQLHVQAAASLFRLGRLRLGSYRIPHSRWDLRFTGSEQADRARWEVRVGDIGRPRAPLKWVLPLERIFAMFKESFCLRTDLFAHPGDESLYDLEIDYELKTPRSALLDLIETLLRWGSRSSVFQDLLGLWHNLAESLEHDLERMSASAGAEERPGD